MTTNQLIFDLPTREAFSREDFMVSPANADALATLDDWARWPERRCALIGSEGSGKTHLAHVWASVCGAEVLTCNEIAKFENTPPVTPVVLDDADRIAGTKDEETLFHLYNAMGAAKLPLLITAKTAPATWDIALPDLASRLATLPNARLKAPDDALLAALLVKQFRDRQVIVNEKLVRFLIPRVERSFEGIRRLVAELDHVAIQEKSAISIPLAKRILMQN